MQTAEQVPAAISCALTQAAPAVQSPALGQAPGEPGAMAVSQVSKGSTVPLPHVEGQSSSCIGDPAAAVAPLGQQLSRGPPTVTISLCTQETVQSLPLRKSLVHATWSSQDCGQAPGLPAAIA